MTDSDQSEEFRFAIVGSGNISRTYLSALDRIDGASAAAIVSRGKIRPDHPSAPNLPVFASLGDVDVPFDAVILCTPNGLHHEGAAAAAALGKHVLTEKCLDITVEHMDSMTRACDQAGVKLGVSYQRRMSPGNIVVKELIETNALGKVFAADMRVKFFRDDDYYASGKYRGGYEIDGGGPFIQQAAHNVDIFVWFFGMPERVASMLGTFTHAIDAEDHGVALLRYGDGMIGTITASSSCKPGFPPGLEIHSDKGTVIMENDEITSWEIDGLEQPGSRTEEFSVHSGSDSAAVSDTSGHEALIEDFVAAVKNDRDPAVPAASGRLATELVLKIYAANIR